MKASSYFKILFILILIFCSSAFAQSSLKGIVTDSVTHEPLVGANVYLVGTSLGSATNLEGEYSIPSVPSGKYIVKVTYIGYKSKQTEVNLTPNKPFNLMVQIVPDVIEGEEVIVTAQAKGQISAINQQRSSNTIINVVSEEKIKELPDQNAAESIGRLPGVSILRSGGEANKVILRGLEDKFTNITIDGVKIPPTDATGRGVDLSMLSQSSLAGIELYKALTPDKDGDGLAGSINLVTKTAPETRYIRADLKGGYNDLMNSAKQYDFSLRYGERFFNNFLGVQLFGNIENKIRSNEGIDVDYNQNVDLPQYWIDDFTLNFTDEVRKRNGLSLLLDFNTPDDGTIRINNVYGGTNRDYFLSIRDYTGQSGGRDNDGAPTFDYRDREQEIRTFNSSITGTNYLFSLSLNWGVSFAQSDSYFPFDYRAYFKEPNGTAAIPRFYQDSPENLIQYARNNFAAAPLQWAYFHKQDNFDKERTAFLDISKQYSIGRLFTGDIKFGGKYKVKDRSNSESTKYTPYYLGLYWQHYSRMPDGTIQPKDFSGSYFENIYNSGASNVTLRDFLRGDDSRNVFDSYSLYPLIDRDKLRQWWELNKNGIDRTGNITEYFDNPLAKIDDYQITERVAAGYLMNTFNLGQTLTFIAGVRVESEDNSYLAEYSKSGAASGFPALIATLGDTTSSSKQTIWLPNFNLSFRPYEFMNLRIAVYKALARPDFNMRLDRYLAGRSVESTGSSNVYVGNPNLKTAQAWNYEVNTSFYGNEFGLISLSAYYKEIKDMYHLLNNFTTFGDSTMLSFGLRWHHGFSSDLSTYNLTLPYNAPKPTKVWGFEFEHQMNFYFLPGLLKNIVLSYNASIVRSETVLYNAEPYVYDRDTIRLPNGTIRINEKVKNRLAERKYKLEGMPEFFGNISLGYDIGGFSGRISMFHQTIHDSSFTANGLTDKAVKSFTRFDLSLKQKITNYLSVFLNINNLTNAEDAFIYRSRRYSRELFDQSQKYGRTADFGVTVEL